MKGQLKFNIKKYIGEEEIEIESNKRRTPGPIIITKIRVKNLH